MKKGKIIRIISNLYTVLVDNEVLQCRCSGKIRNKDMSPVVGDNVLIDCEKKYIEDIEKRKNYITRPVVSNIDEAIIVTSLKSPDLSLNLLDKEISYLTINNIKPIIVVTKKDLLNDKEWIKIKEIFDYYEKLGIKVFLNTQIDDIKKYLENKLVVVTGQTGAGKSSLINKLGKLNILTNEISKALGRGKHTTRHVEIYKIDNFEIADTPGFSALDLTQYTKEELRNSIIEFSEYQCKFKDCMHNKEVDCEVKKVVGKNILESRYLNYIKFLEETKRS